MAIDGRRISAFISASPLRSQIANVLRHAGFTIAWVSEEGNGSRWGFYLKPNLRLRDLFGTAREVLIWVVESPEFQARSVSQAASLISSERPRLCEDFAIIVTLDPNTKTHVTETAELMDTIFLGFSASEFTSFIPHGSSDFIGALQRRLYAKDLYDLPSAVTRAEDFFGRRGLVSDIATRLRRGGRHVGLFGLRKIGKTSMLYRLRSTLQNGNDAYVAHVDIERIDAINPSAEYLLWSLGESIFDSHRHVRSLPKLQLFGKHRLFSDISNRDAVFELFDHDIRLILSKTSRSLVVMLDEVELLSPDVPGSTWGNAFVRIWRLLRGLDQQFPERLSYFVTGTNPRTFEDNFVGGIENPVYNYFSVEYLKPLAAEDVAALLITPGQRMGLAWDTDSIKRVFDATGGHPALTRSLASLVHRSRPDREVSATVTLENVNDAIDRFFIERSSLLSQIVAVLQEQYEDEYYLMNLLAQGNIGDFRAWAVESPSDTAHLVGYGLCSQPQSCRSLDIELLQTFLQRQRRPRAAKSEPNLLPPGSHVDEYEIISSIGAPGGFAKVYTAKAADQSTVALKVLENGLLSALQREIEPLQQIDHPHVVRVLDSGKSTDGLVYMTMELLDGKSLREFCSRSTRATEDQSIEWLDQILSAMISFHPNEALVSELRRKSELETADLIRLEEARYGFVHRDIKPENIIICNRGAVVIDFNISVRASAQVVTRSMTPGYFPPDGLGSTWDVDIDLYDLGITILQATLGMEYAEGGAEDLRLAASEELSPGLAKVLLKLTAPEKSSRYSNAGQVRSDIFRLRVQRKMTR